MTSKSSPASRITLRDFSSRPMRAFHTTWVASFLSFIAWFGIAPLMPVVREDLGLTPAQVGNTVIASVAITVVARLVIGKLLDRYGPRRTYTWLLVLGSLPVMGIGLAQTYEQFLLFRLAIGAIGASFVITQFHTSVMFAPNVVGLANATTAGWGNAGGGAAQFLMPLVMTGIMAATGLGDGSAWRVAMVVPGFALLVCGLFYARLTTDTPEGNTPVGADRAEKPKGTFLEACRDRRVWVLALIYAACFGVELTIHNVAALYFTDYFDLGLQAAGMAAASFGFIALFARSLGGWLGDRFGRRGGLSGRVRWLFFALLGEGVALVAFSRVTVSAMAIVSLVVFALFIHMSTGATYSVVPFVNKRALGSVSGIVGAGGNVGAVASGFLFRGALPFPTAFLILGGVVLVTSFAALTVRFAPAEEHAARLDMEARLAAATA